MVQHITAVGHCHFFLLLLTCLVVNSSTSVSANCSQFIALSTVSSRGKITSPGWPSPYPPNAVCRYKLQGEAWEGVKITFDHFDLEAPYKAGCLSDNLELATVDSRGQRTFRGRFCGSQVPAPILVLHPTAELTFRSNHAVHHDGFSATYEFIDEAFVTPPKLNATSPCGDVLSGIGGTITSPGYPKGYVAGLDCLWLIRVQYSHAIYVRIQRLEFQGSTSNCQKAQLRIYDGYEHSLDEQTVLKKFCGDTRFYKGEEDKVLLSERNRLLIRFSTTEPSKPVNDTQVQVGFQLVWSDVEFDTPGNCTKNSRFPCQEAQICFTKHHTGGTSSCPDLRNYCISSELVCDGMPHCAEYDSSDEQNCYRSPLIAFIVITPLLLLTTCLFVCYLCYKRNNRTNCSGDTATNSNKNDNRENNIKTQSSCCCCFSSSRSSDVNSQHSSKYPSNNAPITRGPIYFKTDLESPGASDIVSPASGFSDTESEICPQTFCPAHGPVPLVPFRYLSRHFPLLPVVQEQVCYSDTYDDGGSTYSSQNSDIIIYDEDKGCLRSPSTADLERDKSTSTGRVNEWRLKQIRRVQRSDAVYMSDDAKSSAASSPGRICPRCLEKDRTSDSKISGATTMATTGTRLDKQVSRESQGIQFDSGIDVIDSIDNVKNISFDTCTSSDSAFSHSFPAVSSTTHVHHHLTPCRPAGAGWKPGLFAHLKPDSDKELVARCNINPHDCSLSSQVEFLEEVNNQSTQQSIQTTQTQTDFPQRESSGSQTNQANDLSQHQPHTPSSNHPPASRTNAYCQQATNDNSFCTTVTTFGVAPDTMSNSCGNPVAKATDV